MVQQHAQVTLALVLCRWYAPVRPTKLHPSVALGTARAGKLTPLPPVQVHPAISLSSEVAAALQHGQPVVALESTIIAHGMPFPQNLETAQAVEAVVRAEGAVPATCAILEGRCCVGLSEAQLHRLASR